MQKRRSQSKKDAVVQAFMNHCAVIIQSHFRGYQQRKYYRKFLPLYRRFKQLLYAGFVGWKTRKTLKLAIVKNKINEMKSLKSQQKNLQLRITKRDLTDQISRLLKNDLWLYYYLKQKKVPLAQKAMMNKNQMALTKKIDLKTAFNIIPKENKIKTIQKRQNPNLSSNLVQKKQSKELSASKKIESEKSFEKQRKNKKFEDPPKQNLGKIQKHKQMNLKIQTKIGPEEVSQSMTCETPNQLTNQLKQFTFHTRPRDQIRENKNYLQVGKTDIEEPFKQIHVNTQAHRKGLNMTLSKKIVEQKMAQSTPINLQVLNDFTKKKIPPQEHLNSQTQSLDLKEVSIFTTKDEERNRDKDLNGKNERLQSGRSLALQMKKEAFEKRKMQFEKKSKQFKTEALK